MFHTIVQLLVLVLVTTVVVTARNPGFKARITPNGLNYANKVALQALKKNAERARIPDQWGYASVFKYTATNIRVTGFTLPDSSIIILPKQGLKWKGSGAAMDVAGDFSYRKWFIGGGGTFTASVSDVNFSLGINMGTDANGRPNITTQSCYSRVGPVNFRFHGGLLSWLYNMFRGKVGRMIRASLNKQLCPMLTKEINVDAEYQLAKLPVTKILAKEFLLDYRLIQSPTFTASYMETYHKGEIYWYTKPTTEAPMKAPAMPESSNAQQMMYLWLSDYVFDTISYVAQKNGYLVRNLTAADLPASYNGVLNTTCSGFIPKCIGTLIPEIGKKYPNTHVTLHLSSGFAPSMKIQSSGISGKCGGSIDIYVVTSAGLVFAARLNATEFLKLLINSVLKPFLMQKLNDLGNKGFPLPVAGDIRFVNTKLTLLQDAIMIATDLKYLAGGFVQKEMNEIHQLDYQPKAVPEEANFKLNSQL